MRKTRQDQIAELVAAGLCDYQITEIVGCHEAYVRAARRRLGLLPNPPVSRYGLDAIDKRLKWARRIVAQLEGMRRQKLAEMQRASDVAKRVARRSYGNGARA